MKTTTAQATPWMKKFSLTAAALVVAVTSMSSQAATVTGNVSYVSDYLFRGISQTNEGMALQGGMTVAADNGAYLSTWGSNISFGDGSMELDLLLGWTGKVSEDWSVDVGVMQYRYPNGDNADTEFNFVEWYAKAIYGDLVLGYAYASDYFGADVDKYQYFSADHTYKLKDDWAIVSHVGYNSFEDSEQFQTFLAAGPVTTSNYTDFAIGVSKTYMGASFALKFAGTDIGKSAECPLCDDRAVFSITKNF